MQADFKRTNSLAQNCGFDLKKEKYSRDKAGIALMP
jgi:hypothetical protein